MSQDKRHDGPRQKPLSAGGQATSMTVSQFAKKIVDWLVEWADEDDIRRFVAEFDGVPIENVSVIGNDIRIVTRE